jgi:hypothetical protein
MIMLANRFVAGAVAGVAISGIGLVYALVRKDQMLAMFMQPDQERAGMSAQAATWMLFGSMLFMGPFLGLLAALVYGWLPSRTAYLGLALGLATLMSIGAIASRTPMVGAKIALNYIVALTFGLLLPRLAVAA